MLLLRNDRRALLKCYPPPQPTQAGKKKEKEKTHSMWTRPGCRERGRLHCSVLVPCHAAAAAEEDNGAEGAASEEDTLRHSASCRDATPPLPEQRNQRPALHLGLHSSVLLLARPSTGVMYVPSYPPLSTHTHRKCSIFCVYEIITWFELT